eukprot:Protomagalhaensia_sp_Gyna_25__4229@NODE_384_length_3628_cov_64_801337_g295_i0_p2_GENE_NODE_384_length_3628_cov_64_801337_g295_i0NODE_384_length_3628_cov_64_801337_g295_i0_p2_ORF_typecomplete_len361_score54_13Adaptin_N/PF01602_20/0_0043RTTN_N/PF14726_6/1_1e03RTTN_N/PF14726_6/1Arm_2/PF04826_13/2_4e03Arm_2/PF04826_13/0_42_NODE_384_length_3628_cov_64_801337_g295_i01431225
MSTEEFRVCVETNSALVDTDVMRLLVVKYLGRLAETNDINEGLVTIGAIQALYETSPWTLDANKVLVLLTYLERTSASDVLSEGRTTLIRRTAELIASFHGLLPDREPLTRPIHSPLMVQTDDPTVLLALCRLLWQYVVGSRSEDIHGTITSELASSVTVLDRLLELLHHPSSSLREIILDVLHEIVDNDEGRDFCRIGERVVNSAREMLIRPLPVSRSPKPPFNLLNLLSAVGGRYPECIQPSIDSGLVEDMLLFLESDVEILEPDRTSTRAILSFLYDLVRLCNKDQMYKLAHMGCFDVVGNFSNHPELRSRLGFYASRILTLNATKGIRKQIDQRQPTTVLIHCLDHYNLGCGRTIK